MCHFLKITLTLQFLKNCFYFLICGCFLKLNIMEAAGINTAFALNAIKADNKNYHLH